ncbi:MAG: immunity 70 family protein [Novosphingobium sp.]|nr:immunity 70 family protein [Novosphingobium sp.]
MGLYLTIFAGDEELDGVEVGAYADFSAFRDAVVSNLEAGNPGSRFPTLILHSDCDGEWSPVEAALLETELEEIARELASLPPVSLGDGWKPEVAKMFGIRPANLADCFFDVDGEPLLERLIGLAKLSQERNLPILFQ